MTGRVRITWMAACPGAMLSISLAPSAAPEPPAHERCDAGAVSSEAPAVYQQRYKTTLADRLQSDINIYRLSYHVGDTAVQWETRTLAGDVTAALNTLPTSAFGCYDPAVLPPVREAGVTLISRLEKVIAWYSGSYPSDPADPTDPADAVSKLFHATEPALDDFTAALNRYAEQFGGQRTDSTTPWRDLLTGPVPRG